MKYEKGTFITVPNKKALAKQPAILQALFMWICSFADENGECYPSRTTLARLICVSAPTIDKYLQELVNIGFITKEERVIEGVQTSNLYQIMIIEGVVNDVNRPTRFTGGVKLVNGGSKTEGGGGSVTGLHELNTLITKPNEHKPSPKKEVDPLEVETNRIIGLFSTLDPANFKSFFEPGAQRSSAKKIIKAAQEASVTPEELIKMAKAAHGVQYQPQIFNPCQMIEKMSKLIAFSKKTLASTLDPSVPHTKGKYSNIKSTSYDL